MEVFLLALKDVAEALGAGFETVPENAAESRKPLQDALGKRESRIAQHGSAARRPRLNLQLT